MKQFNLEEYLKNPLRKVVTRDGREVRIICTDKKGTFFPIVALVKCENREETYYYTTKGDWTFGGTKNNLDLFFAPEKHEGWVNIYRDIRDITYVGGIYTSEKEAKENIYFPSRYITTIKIEWEE